MVTSLPRWVRVSPFDGSGFLFPRLLRLFFPRHPPHGNWFHVKLAPGFSSSVGVLSLLMAGPFYRSFHHSLVHEPLLLQKDESSPSYNYSVTPRSAFPWPTFFVFFRQFIFSFRFFCPFALVDSFSEFQLTMNRPIPDPSGFPCFPPFHQILPTFSGFFSKVASFYKLLEIYPRGEESRPCFLPPFFDPQFFYDRPPSYIRQIGFVTSFEPSTVEKLFISWCLWAFPSRYSLSSGPQVKHSSYPPSSFFVLCLPITWLDFGGRAEMRSSVGILPG